MSTTAMPAATRPPPSAMRLKKLEELKLAHAKKSYVSTNTKMEENVDSPVPQSKTPLVLPPSWKDMVPTVTINVKEGRGGQLITTPWLHDKTKPPNNAEILLGPCRIRKSAFANPCFGKTGDLGTSKFSNDPAKAKWSVMIDDKETVEFVEDTTKRILRAVYHSKDRDDKWEEVIGEKSVTEFLDGVTYPCVKTDTYSGDKYFTLGRKLKTWQGAQYIKFWKHGDTPVNIHGNSIKQEQYIQCGCTFRAYVFQGKYGVALDLGKDVVLVPDPVSSPSKRKREDEEEDPDDSKRSKTDSN